MFFLKQLLILLTLCHLLFLRPEIEKSNYLVTTELNSGWNPTHLRKKFIKYDMLLTKLDQKLKEIIIKFNTIFDKNFKRYLKTPFEFM